MRPRRFVRDISSAVTKHRVSNWTAHRFDTERTSSTNRVPHFRLPTYKVSKHDQRILVYVLLPIINRTTVPPCPSIVRRLVTNKLFILVYSTKFRITFEFTQIHRHNPLPRKNPFRSCSFSLPAAKSENFHVYGNHRAKVFPPTSLYKFLQQDWVPLVPPRSHAFLIKTIWH